MSIPIIIYYSIGSGICSTLCKLANVILTDKKGATDSKQRKLSTSISCVLSQQHARETRTWQHTIFTTSWHQKLLHGNQSWFHTQHSCETALNCVVHKWALAIDKGLVNGVVILNLRKAFDLMNHTVVLHLMLDLRPTSNSSWNHNNNSSRVHLRRIITIGLRLSHLYAVYKYKL